VLFDVVDDALARRSFVGVAERIRPGRARRLRPGRARRLPGPTITPSPLPFRREGIPPPWLTGGPHPTGSRARPLTGWHRPRPAAGAGRAKAGRACWARGAGTRRRPCPDPRPSRGRRRSHRQHPRGSRTRGRAAVSGAVRRRARSPGLPRPELCDHAICHRLTGRSVRRGVEATGPSRYPTTAGRPR